MKHHVWVVSDLVSKLESLGVVTTDPSGKNVMQSDGPVAHVPPSLQKAAVLKRQGASVTDLSATSPSSFVDTSDTTIPTKYWSMESLSSTLLATRLLPSIDPEVLTPARLRYLHAPGLKVGERHTQQLQLVGFLTGLSPEFPLTGKLRYWDSLIQLCQKHYTANGSRAKSLKLPIDFTSNGIFSLEPVQGADIVIKDDFTGETKMIKHTDLPPHQEFGDLYVDLNWSFELAAIRFSQGGSEIVCASVFNQSGPRVLAIEDGAVEEEQGDSDSGADKSPMRKRVTSTGLAEIKSFFSDLAKKRKLTSGSSSSA